MPNNLYDEIAAGVGSMARMSFAPGATVCNLTSAIGTAYDHDWIGIQLVAGHQYRFNARGFDTTLTLRDALGRQLAYNDDFGGTLNSQITFTATSTGLYFLDVAGYSASVGNYGLSATDLTPAPAPADIAGNAQTVASLAVGANASSTIGFAGDHDWFRIDLQAGHQYCFNAGGFDTTLTLRDALGRQLAYNDDFGGTLNSQITFTATYTGLYFLDVAGYSASVGNYGLSATDLTPAPADIAGNAQTVALLAVGANASSTIGFAGDHDWFRIDLQAGHQYCFNAGGFDTTLTLRDALGRQLAYNDDFGGTLNSQITFTATYTGLYFLDVAGYSASVGNYGLSATDLTPAPADIAGNAQTVALLAVGANASSTIGFAGDHDWFRIDLQAGHQYRFNAGGFNTALTLRDSAGQQLAFNDDSNGTLNSEITFSAGSTGTYFLDVQGWNNLTGTYTLGATDTTPTDILATTQTSAALAVGSSLSSNIGVAYDRDWFRIDLQAGHQYRFNAGGIDTTLALKDSAGQQLAFNDDSLGPNSEITFLANSTGTYYLDVAGHFNTTGSYTLKATDTALPDVAAGTQTSNSIAVGGIVTSNSGWMYDHDWFRITLVQGHQYQFDAAGIDINTGQTNGFDANLGLTRADGSYIAQDSNASTAAQIRFTAEYTGAYYLDVSGGLSTPLGSYVLQSTDLSSPPPSPSPSLYVNDILADTQTSANLAVGASASSDIGFSNDHDWFRINLQAGHRYQFNVGGFDPTLALRNEAGQQIAFNDDSNGSRHSEITFLATSTGIHYLDVGEWASNSTGAYTIQAVLVA